MALSFGREIKCLPGQGKLYLPGIPVFSVGVMMTPVQIGEISMPSSS